MPVVDDNATVTATFSRRMRLHLRDGNSVEARIKGKTLRPVCGDRVTAEPLQGESDWLITEIAERRNALTRPNAKGSAEVLAANVDIVVVVAAVAPLPDWFIVDRYLAAAELMPAVPIVVFNKTDLLQDSGLEIDELDELDDYQRAEYAVISTSTETGDGIDRLAQCLTQQRAIIVGQSGVGKSSLINALTGTTQQKTGDISSKSLEGRHTTVNSVMIDLKNGSQIIDSPGVRDFAPALIDSGFAAEGFREIAALAPQCRFANCRHLREPGCAVKAAVASGALSERRYESYRRLVFLTEKLNSGKR